MNTIPNLLLLAGALTLPFPAHQALAAQSSTQTAVKPRANTTNQAASPERRHHRRTNTTRLHPHHKRSSRH